MWENWPRMVNPQLREQGSAGGVAPHLQESSALGRRGKDQSAALILDENNTGKSEKQLHSTPVRIKSNSPLDHLPCVLHHVPHLPVGARTHFHWNSNHSLGGTNRGVCNIRRASQRHTGLRGRHRKLYFTRPKQCRLWKETIYSTTQGHFSLAQLFKKVSYFFFYYFYLHWIFFRAYGFSPTFFFFLSLLFFSFQLFFFLIFPLSPVFAIYRLFFSYLFFPITVPYRY